jgi:ERCC4-type nuclease
MEKKIHMKIIRDTREQEGFCFTGSDCSVVEGSLPTGEYSLLLLEHQIAVERKELNDLVGCLTSGRERFTRELERGRGIPVFAVVVEADWIDLATGCYRSKMEPAAATASVLSLSMRYRVPFYFCGSRAEAESVTYNLLRLFLQSTEKKLKAIVKAHGGGEAA